MNYYSIKNIEEIQERFEKKKEKDYYKFIKTKRRKHNGRQKY